MFFKQILVGPMQNFNYVIGDEKEAAFVDPAFEEQKLFDALEGRELSAILLTHTHPDHIEALGRVLEKKQVPVYVHPNEKNAVDSIATDIKTIDEGDTLHIGSTEIKVHFTPGHTTGGITFEAEKKLITGDALFVEGCGRIDLPGGDREVLLKTLAKLATFPEDYEVYPGHDYGSMPHSTIAHEKEHNDFMRSAM